MAKKCIPGVICIENMTLFLLFVLLIFVTYLYYTSIRQNIEMKPEQNTNVMFMQPTRTVSTYPSLAISATRDPFNDPYSPPLKNDGIYFPPDSADIRGVVGLPINMQTRGYSTGYTQIGILTRQNGSGDMILPLMGRRIMNGRNKLQYYTISNTGSLNTKLPISVNGKSCSNEYGCDEMSNSDNVYVEGYNDIFRSTIYENGLFSYIPAIL